MKTSTSLKYNVHLIIAFLLFFSASIQTAKASYFFFVQFSDKNNSPYSLSNPSEFLSERAIARRQYFSCAYDSTDLPINPSYLSQVQNLGVPVYCRSKWMNGATVLVSDSSIMSQVRVLPFVKWVQYTGIKDDAAAIQANKIPAQINTDYGTATTQIDQLNGKYLHNLGYRGKGIYIGVIDDGFNSVDTNPAFDSLRLQGRLLGTKDFVNPTSNIYAEDAHGTKVLSTMAGNLPNLYLGTAPDASYWLIRTENAPTEYLVEPDFWTSGIEFADSVGIDVVNSSLGYTTFSDTTMNFKYADMNGKVSRASRAATLASQKGIIICNSAGNEGGKAWKYIGTPADADGIITVGSVTSTGTPASTSSFGPSSDGRVKPEICARGYIAALIGITGTTTTGSGTSYASPIMAGMMACFLQDIKSTHPSYNLKTLLNAIFESGTLFNNPTAQMGYGIPNFQTALANLPLYNGIKLAETKDILLTFDNKNKALHIQLSDEQSSTGKSVRIYSMMGHLMTSQSLSAQETVIHNNNFTAGIYAVCILENGKTNTYKVIIK